MPDNNQRRQSARAQVANRNPDQLAEELAEQRAEVEKRMNDATGWFAKVAPAHVDADRFVALAIGHVRKIGGKLLQGCIQNPDTLMIALVDCARLGLVIGDTYHPVPFYDKHSGTYKITGIRDYKGEIELIYRSGMVDAVFGYVVRGHQDAKTPDHFNWRPGMTFPEHVIADDGLADEVDRGHLRGAYAYARLSTGGYSPVIVMSKAKVLRTRPANAPAEFWGPEWPAEGPNTEAMWRKGPLHRLFNVVPHSSDYVAEMQRASASVVDVHQQMGLPAPGVAAIEPPGEGSLALDPADLSPDAAERRASVRSQTEKPMTKDQLRREIGALFDLMNFSRAGEVDRLLVARVLIRDNPEDDLVKLSSTADLTQPQLVVLAGKLAKIRDEALAGKREAGDDLVKIAKWARDKESEMANHG